MNSHGGTERHFFVRSVVRRETLLDDALPRHEAGRLE
jgi:hypothetical protein